MSGCLDIVLSTDEGLDKSVFNLEFSWNVKKQKWRTHTHTHNRAIIKLRDMETSDETQLIWGLLPMESPHPLLRLSQLLRFLPPSCSRQSLCPHSANLSPLTQNFTPFKAHLPTSFKGSSQPPPYVGPSEPTFQDSWSRWHRGSL